MSLKNLKILLNFDHLLLYSINCYSLLGLKYRRSRPM